MVRTSVEKIKETVLRLIKLNNTPREIALGIALGVFIAILPLYGFHTILMITFAILIPSANKIAILLGTNISLPPTAPFITWAGYEIGRFILGKNYPPLTWAYFGKINFQAIRDLFYPLFLGSVILGIICAIFFYFLALFFVKKIQSRKEHGG